MLLKTSNFKHLGLLCLFASSIFSSAIAAEPTDGIEPLPGFGYLFIRILGSRDERVPRIEFSNLDSEYVAITRSDKCQSAGPNAWACLEMLPPGRYFWSKYQSDHRIGMERSTNQDPVIRREVPSSKSDSFEIVADVVNYVGDWNMKLTELSESRRWSMDVRQNSQTIGRLYELYPETANRYEIYLSMMGKKAISLQEFLKIMEKNSK